MVRKSLLLILALAGFASADTGFPSTIKVTETDNSPSCIAGQIKFGAGQVSCSGQTATVTITGGGGGGSSSLAVTAGVSRSSPTSDLMFNPNQFSGSVSASSITISLVNSSVTLQGQNVIKLQDTLQSGATFYVSSGTVNTYLNVGSYVDGNGMQIRGGTSNTEHTMLKINNGNTSSGNKFNIDFTEGSGYAPIVKLQAHDNSGVTGTTFKVYTSLNGSAYNTSAGLTVTGSHTSGTSDGSNVGVNVESPSAILDVLQPNVGSTNSFPVLKITPDDQNTGSLVIVKDAGGSNLFRVNKTSVSAEGAGGFVSTYGISGGSITIASTGTIGGVGICLENGTACPASSGSGMSAGATYYIQVRESLQSGATFYVSSGTVQSEFNVGDGVHDGLITYKFGADTYNVIGSSVTGTEGLCAVASSSRTIRWQTCGTGTGGGGGASGTINAADQFSLPYYSLAGSTTQVSGYPNVTLSTVTAITFSTGTTFTSSITITNVSTWTLTNVALSISSHVALSGSVGNSGQVLTSQGYGSSPIWTTPTTGGGGSSSLAVFEDQVNVSSPTAILKFDGGPFNVSLPASGTAYVTIEPTYVLLASSAASTYLQNSSASVTYLNVLQGLTAATAATTYLTQSSATATYLQQTSATLTYLQLSSATATYLNKNNAITLGSFSATQPILYNNATGAFSATPISLSTGVVGVLPIANGGTNTSSTLTGLVRGGASYTAAELSGDATTSGSNVVTVVDDSHNHTGTTLSAINGNTITTQIPSTVLPSTIAFITSTQTYTAYRNIVASTTYSGAIYLSSSIVTVGQGAGTSGQVLQSQGNGAAPIWATSSGGGYATIADEASDLTQRTKLNFTGSGVSCADNAGSSRTDCTINAGAASAGGSSGNIQFNDGGSLGGLQGSSISGNTIIISTGGINSYKVVLSSTEVNVGSFTVNSGMVAFNGISTMTSTAQWDQNAAFTFNGKQGKTYQMITSSGPSLAPRWGPTYATIYTTSVYTAVSNTIYKVPQLAYNLTAGSTYHVNCHVIFQSTATVLGGRFGMFATAGSTIAITVEIPTAADGTAGMFQGWITSAGDIVTGTAVQAINTNYIAHIYGMILTGADGNLNVTASGEVTNGNITVRDGSMCVITGLSP